MRERLLAFVGTLRAEGVAVSVAETLDALEAVAVSGIERPTLREALAATLVKDERDRAPFDRLFDAAFPLGSGQAAVSRGGRRDEAGGAGAGGGRGLGDGVGRGRRPPEDAAARPGTGMRPASQPGRRDAVARDHEGDVRGESRAGCAARRATLLDRPLAELTARDVAEARELVRDLGARLRGRLARRERQLRRGRVDVRRTLRAAVASGGVPLLLWRRGRRPGRPDLVALCDLSGSVAAASELLLGLIAPASRFFRRVHLYAYVDRLCPVSIERGHVAPGGSLDLHARSDFGRVLGDLWATRGILGRGTLLLVLGDARNNRLPPRGDLLRAVRERVRRVLWLVPEARARWNTGDSVLRVYAPSCDAVVECLTLRDVVEAVGRAL